MLTLPDDGLLAIGSLPVAIEASPLLESVRDTAVTSAQIPFIRQSSSSMSGRVSGSDLRRCSSDIALTVNQGS
jgi:hypothetical protein